MRTFIRWLITVLIVFFAIILGIFIATFGLMTDWFIAKDVREL